MCLGVDMSGMSGPEDSYRSDPASSFRENITGIVSVLVTGIWLAALLLGFEWWLPFMLFGYIAIIPIVSMLFDEDEEESDAKPDWQQSQHEQSTDDRRDADAADESTEDALQTLRQRYARGELTDRQFERKLERLLETETLEDAEDRYRRERAAAERDRESTTELDLETETE